MECYTVRALKGIIYGNNSRVMVSAVVECRRPNQEITRCNVHFLFDTGAPATYLTKEAFEALGVNDPKIDGTRGMGTGWICGYG